jgi:hypothetical protein
MARGEILGGCRKLKDKTECVPRVQGHEWSRNCKALLGYCVMKEITLSEGLDYVTRQTQSLWVRRDLRPRMLLDQLDAPINEVTGQFASIQEETLDGLIYAVELRLTRTPKTHKVVSIGDAFHHFLKKDSEEIADAIPWDSTVSEDRSNVATSVLILDKMLEGLEIQPPESVFELGPSALTIKRYGQIRPKRPLLVVVNTLGHQIDNQDCRKPAENVGARENSQTTDRSDDSIVDLSFKIEFAHQAVSAKILLEFALQFDDTVYVGVHSSGSPTTVLMPGSDSPSEPISITSVPSMGSTFA